MSLTITNPFDWFGTTPVPDNGGITVDPNFGSTDLSYYDLTSPLTLYGVANSYPQFDAGNASQIGQNLLSNDPAPDTSWLGSLTFMDKIVLIAGLAAAAFVLPPLIKGVTK